MRRVVATIAVALFAGILAPLGLAQPATATGDETAAFVAHINTLRAAKGVGALRTDPALTAVAARWTDRMVEAAGISHNPELGSQVAASWVSLGENVGVGTDVDALFQAFVDSPSHYANLVDPEYQYLAVATRWGPDGRLYTTHLFMSVADAAPSPAPSARMAIVLAELRDITG